MIRSHPRVSPAKKKWAEDYYRGNPSASVRDGIVAVRSQFNRGLRWDIASKIRTRVRAKLASNGAVVNGHSKPSEPIKVVNLGDKSPIDTVREAARRFKEALDTSNIQLKRFSVDRKDDGTWDVDVEFLSPQNTRFDL